MNQPPEFWTMLNTFFLVVLAFIALYNNHNTKNIAGKVDAVHKELDGAKGVLLDKIETLTQFKSDTTGARLDADKAFSAAEIATEHRAEIEKGKAQGTT